MLSFDSSIQSQLFQPSQMANVLMQISHETPVKLVWDK